MAGMMIIDCTIQFSAVEYHWPQNFQYLQFTLKSGTQEDMYLYHNRYPVLLCSAVKKNSNYCTVMLSTHVYPFNKIS